MNMMSLKKNHRDKIAYFNMEHKNVAQKMHKKEEKVRYLDM